MLGQRARPTAPSPTSASPTAGIDPRTLEQLLSLFKQNMARQPKNRSRLPAKKLTRRSQAPSAFQRMQLQQGRR